jgi:hypothetical protein
MSLGHIELQQRCRLPQKREGGKEGWDKGGRLSSLTLSLPPHSSRGGGMSSGGGAGHRGGSSYGSSVQEGACVRRDTHILGVARLAVARGGSGAAKARAVVRQYVGEHDAVLC